MIKNNTRQTENSVIDNVLTTQDGLGPKIPDGGYGWVVFLATLFFCILIPSLASVFGLLLTASKLNTELPNNASLNLWDDNLIYVCLFFAASWTSFDPTSRNFISYSTWPRLVGITGNCITCSGLLFLWMGMAKNSAGLFGERSWFVLAGMLSGIGSSIQMAQCEILLAQYFKLKHLYLTHLSHMAISAGFIFTPIIISSLALQYELLHVILIYQCILLQGLIINIVFKKPPYLKSKIVNYNYMMDNVDEEEDIFSKSLTELKIKTKDVLRKFELKSTPTEKNFNTEQDVIKKNENWESFDDENSSAQVHSEEIKTDDNEVHNNYDYKIVDNNSSNPVPLFNDSSVNMNTTYAFDDDMMENGPYHNPVVFTQPKRIKIRLFEMYMTVIQQPTFYKSLLTVITTRFSIFIFFSLFPTYIYLEVENLKFKTTGWIVGCLSISTFIFAGVSYWVNVNKEKRSIFLFIFCWLGALGYFLISTSSSKSVLIFGGLMIILSIACLQHTGSALLGLTLKGESNQEYVVLSVLTGLSFLIFLLLDYKYKTLFLLMALLYIITGLLWVANYFYKY